MKQSQATIPMKEVGPIKIIGAEINAELQVPLATFEAPLWPSVNRGARVTRMAGGINVTLINECMTRSILLEAESAQIAQQVMQQLTTRRNKIESIVATSSKFAKLQEWHTQIVANFIYLRFAFTTGDAAGHNMVTKASEAIQNWILQNYPALKYVSVSGNYCVDKKNSAVNGILGRGKNVIAEVVISAELCQKQLHTTSEKIVALNIKKNLIGAIIAGSVRSANAHFANMLLAFYLATGQDAANIVEGSQGITYAELRGQDLYFSVTLPNIIVGSVGSGKKHEWVQENLRLVGCLDERPVGANARRLALITAAVVLCGELSLMAAQTNPGELMRAHEKIERQKNLY